MKPNTVGRATGDKAPARELHAANGLLAGARIFTQDGELPVEFIGAGDRIITRDAGLVAVRAVRSRRVFARTVAVKAGSLGHTKPDQDCVLLASQQVLLRDWRAEAIYGRPQAMVAAERLVDGEFISDRGTGMVTIYELEFETPHVIYADGLEVASFVPAESMAEA